MTILLIEDDPFFQKFYSFKLREQHFNVFIAKDGIEGMQMVRSNMPNLILLDLIMPNKDGFGVLEDLAADATLKNIPVLVFSTLSQEKDIERAKSLGAKDYVNKSFLDFDKLLAKIQSLITQPQTNPQ